MITLHERGVWLVGGTPVDAYSVPAAEARKRTMAWRILQAHNRSDDPNQLRVSFDAMLSHDITYVGIIQQARASGMTEVMADGKREQVYTCLWGSRMRDARPFEDEDIARSMAKKIGGCVVISARKE